LKSPWKRRLLIAVLVVVALLAIPASLIASAFIGMSSLQPREFGSDSWIKDGIVGIGVIDEGGGRIALIDAGNDPDGKVILAELARRHLTADAVRDIFLTHGHPDHTGAAHLFPAAHVYIGVGDAALAQGRDGSHGPLTHFFGPHDSHIAQLVAVPSNQELTAGEKKVWMFMLPGHTAGSSAFLVDGLLFLGDSAGLDSHGKLRGAPYAMSDSQSENRASLRRLADEIRASHLEVKAMLPAHSGTSDSAQPLFDFAAANR